MIALGIIGLSRGDANEGDMKGRSMSSFISLNSTCLGRFNTLKGWLNNWIEPYADSLGWQLDSLEVDNWFTIGDNIVGGLLNTEKMSDSRLLPKCKCLLTNVSNLYV